MVVARPAAGGIGAGRIGSLQGQLVVVAGLDRHHVVRYQRGRCRVVDHRARAGGRQDVGQLGREVAGVQVDRDGAELEAGEEDLEVLGPVGQQHADPVVAGDALHGEHLGQPVGPVVELGVGAPALGRDHGVGPGRGVDRRFEPVGQVAPHRAGT